jgi:hypothetical protein
MVVENDRAALIQRNHMPMNCTAVSAEAGVAALAQPGVAKDIERVCALWGGAATLGR